MFTHQTIRTAHGVSAFGSALIRVAPDFASLRFSVTRSRQKPSEAFSETRAGAKTVRDFLTSTNVTDVAVSRMTLRQDRDYRTSNCDYVAMVHFNALLHDFELLEDVLCGVIASGVNVVDDVTFHSSKLKEYRNEVRALAAKAARNKAETYASSLGTTVGRVMHIEDVDPTQLQGDEGQVSIESTIDGGANAFNPGHITVSGAVIVVFAIKDL